MMILSDAQRLLMSLFEGFSKFIVIIVPIILVVIMINVIKECMLYIKNKIRK